MQIKSLIRGVACLAACLFASISFSSSPAEGTPESAQADRWEKSLAAFAADDLRNSPPDGAVLFVGSSSIRLWDKLEEQFESVPVVKRGFGGSRLSDCVKHLDRLVIKYRPRLVMVYAGDNDLAEGATPEDVLKRFKAFAEGVHKRLPETQIAFISIKPSPARRALIDAARAANDLVRAYADAEPRVEYVDVFTPMLTVDGSPRRDLFRGDSLHLNDAGYALWRKVMLPFVH